MIMYEAYFNMKHTPFTRDVPPEKLYESPAIGAAFDRLCYVADRQLFAVVTADSGCGKSTLLKLLLGFEKPVGFQTHAKVVLQRHP